MFMFETQCVRFFLGVSQLSPWLLRRSFKMTRKQRNSLCKSFSALLLDRTNNIQWSKDAIFHMPFMLHVQNVCSQHPVLSCLSGYCQGQTIPYRWWWFLFGVYFRVRVWHLIDIRHSDNWFWRAHYWNSGLTGSVLCVAEVETTPRKGFEERQRTFVYAVAGCPERARENRICSW